MDTSFELSQDRSASAQAMIVAQSDGGGCENLARVAILMGAEGNKRIERSHGGRQEQEKERRRLNEPHVM